MYSELREVKKINILNHVRLHLLVNQLSISTMPEAIRKKSHVINEIPGELMIHTDASRLAAVLGQLLITMISHSHDSSIRISAKKYGKVILLHLKENSRLNSPAFATSLVEIQHLADRIGGNVSVTSYRNEVTTVALSFIDQHLVA